MVRLAISMDSPLDKLSPGDAHGDLYAVRGAKISALKRGRFSRAVDIILAFFLSVSLIPTITKSMRAFAQSPQHYGSTTISVFVQGGLSS